jgi:hypothetical protein
MYEKQHLVSSYWALTDVGEILDIQMKDQHHQSTHKMISAWSKYTGRLTPGYVKYTYL